MTVRLIDVTKRFRAGSTDVLVLDGVNLTLEQGRSLALIGHSGAGKSTLLSIIAGLERPTSGTVTTADVNLGTAKPRALASFRFHHVGFVFQQYHLIPTLTALENVMLPCAPWKVDFNVRQRAMELLALVGLRERTGHLPAQLSGGEQQRVSIARALVNHPTLLLADEPTGNLDDESAGEVMRLIRELSAQLGLTLLIVTHDTDLARSFDQVLRIRQGRLEPDIGALPAERAESVQ